MIRNYRRRGFDFSDFTVTKREVLASISIVAILMLIGVLISSKISESQMDRMEMYNKAIKIDSQQLFTYGMETNIGNAFIYGDLEAVDTVTFPEIGGEYMSVTKVKEVYTMHTRMVTKTRVNSKGKTETYTTEEIYWEWDKVNEWKDNCKNVKFLNVGFEYGEIYKPHEKYITTQKVSSDVRYKYYGSPIKYTGTLFAELGDMTIRNARFYNDMTINETIDYLDSNGGVIAFWIVWIIVIGRCVYAFYYIDNEWLE